MDKTFDELFNEFFKRKKTKSNDGFESSMTEMHKKIIDMLTNFTQNDNIENIIENKITNLTTKPDKIEFYNEGDMFFEKRTWHTKDGDLVKITISDEPYLPVTPAPQKSLQEKLDEAVKNEEYMKAATIRDLIKKSKNETKKQTK